MMTGMIPLILTGLLRVLRTRRALVLENLALRHQLAVLQRTAPRPRWRRSPGRLPYAPGGVRPSGLRGDTGHAEGSGRPVSAVRLGLLPPGV
jgi:hypothetical protein